VKICDLSQGEVPIVDAGPMEEIPAGMAQGKGIRRGSWQD